MIGSAQTAVRLEQAKPQPYEYPKPPKGAPNILMVVLDDVGFAQIGSFGSIIETPSIDRLAAGGLRFNRFHVTSICSSTRAALLTGRNHHAVGVGVTHETSAAFPGYTGRIPRSAATTARVLRDAGYSTMAVGKWHLAGRGETSASGPMDRWPLGLGFERFYGFLGALTSQWVPELVRDNSHIEAPRTPEAGYHLSEDLADETIRMILDQHQATPHKPFFCYLAMGAAHSPHQVLPAWSDPYQGRFEEGWESMREQIFQRQLDAGVIPHDTILGNRPDWIPDWDLMTGTERRVCARYMEVFAGFVTHADAQIGRVVDFLKLMDLLDDTIVLVLSDNGASSEGSMFGTLNESDSIYGVPTPPEEALAQAHEIGGQKFFNHYPWGWAWAGNTPFRLWKRYSWLGGTRTPLIIHWPGRIDDGGAVRDQFCHAIDIHPTLLDVIGVAAPESVDGFEQQRMDGVSFSAALSDATAPETRFVQYFEMHGSRAIYRDGWKATTDHVSPYMRERQVIPGSAEFSTDRWNLFDLTTDFSEATDVADHHPEIVTELEHLWWAEAGRNQVLPLFEGPATTSAAPQSGEYPPPARALYRPGGGPIAGASLPNMIGGFTIDTDFEVTDGRTDGILCALGDRNGGFALYIRDGRAIAHLRVIGGTCRLEALDVLTPGLHKVSMSVSPSDEGPLVNLIVDKEIVDTTIAPGAVHFLVVSSGCIGMLIGRDRGLPVSDDYTPPFAFEGILHSVEMVSAAPDAQYDQRAVAASTRTD